MCLTLTWSENCVLTIQVTREDNPDADPAVAEIKKSNKRNISNNGYKVLSTSLYFINWKQDLKDL